MDSVVLVNEQDEMIGSMEKMEAHQKGALHRAFSVFLFNDENELLLQQRALSKYHSAGLWTNSCCSHPMPEEDIHSAALRRIKEELGIEADIKRLYSFIYKAEFDNGLIEHELDHVFIGNYNGDIPFNRDEVHAIKYTSLNDLEIAINEKPSEYTEWLKIIVPHLKKILNTEQ